MARRTPRVILTALLVAVVLAGCTTDGSSVTSGVTDRYGTVRPSGAKGVLVPGSLHTTGAGTGPLRLAAVYAHGRFHLNAARGGYSLDQMSGTGRMVRADGLPLRCGGIRYVGPSRRRIVAARVRGAHSFVTQQDADGTRVLIDAYSQPMFQHDPSRVRQIGAEAMVASIFLTPAQVHRFVGRPRTTMGVEQWHHHFDGGLDVDASLRGNLAEGFTFSFDSRADGHKEGVSAAAGFMPCDLQGIWAHHTSQATYQPVLVSEGARLTVDGKVDRDLVPEPALQGAWAIVKVPKDGRPVTVEITQTSTGKRLARWEQKYEVPADD